MGVTGLASFVKSQQCFDSKYRLHDCKIVIDANNLYHFIYYHHKVPYRCGGDYHLFVAKIKMYFKTFETCNISPYLVFDGGYETDNRKLNTCLSRARQRIYMSQSLARGGSGSVTPALTSQTFLNVIKDLGIPCVVGDFEADSQTMLLANQWNCPVLSNDSDFYIYDVTGGFIMLDSVDYNPKSFKEESSGKTYKFLECQIYFCKNFTDLFPGLNKSLLPLFSTLCGNDYVSSKGIFDKFFCNMKKAPDNFGQNIARRKQHAMFLSLLYWLHNQSSIEEAITNILNFFKIAERKKLQTLISKSVTSYISVESCFDMKEYFETDKLVFKSPGFKKFCHNCILPEWFIHRLKRCQLSVSFLNVVRLRRIILMSQIEHMSYPSVYTCSTYIRQVIYGILLLDNVEKESINKLSIEEYDRDGCNYKKKKIDPVFTIPNFGPLPSLSDISSATLDIKRQIMLLTLGSDLEFLKEFPDELKIVAITIVYWVKNANPQIHKAMVTALVVCNIYLWIKISKDKTETKKVFLQSSAGNQKSMYKLIEGANNEILNQVNKNLIKFCGNPSYDWKTKINTPVVHNFNQFQVTLRYVLHLNQLLQEPFYATSPSFIFSGTFLCNLFLEICGRANPQEFLSNLLVPGSEFESLFISCDNAFHLILKPCYIAERTMKKKSQKKRKKKSQNIHMAKHENSDLSDNNSVVNFDTENRFNVLA
ncbi:protein asteroid homolog 1-like [Octopus sinensis]|uniref:Protein asteroid homolog 1-like n=1 Tax=Octopus sinensis TaxID=2607531 RepID=A0A6P7SUN2_9MOLL|nr:protein asteroid homolog 1-like [Octopus sinensis]XP_036362345.1 protein asteroid homolog 1-like [Octopus sinensis]XP_036362346.1 protein asteroid homolog 1-like [Octopus sinensis]